MGIFGRRRSRGTPKTSPQNSYRQLDADPKPKGSPAIDGVACRICLSDEGELITPCACRGDSAHVHRLPRALGAFRRTARGRVAALRSLSDDL